MFSYSDEPKMVPTFLDAVRRNDVELIKLILEDHPTIVLKVNEKKESGLSIAVTNNYFTAINIIFNQTLRLKKYTELKIKPGWTPFHFAAGYCDYQSFKNLLELMGEDATFYAKKMTLEGSLPLFLAQGNLQIDSHLIVRDIKELLKNKRKMQLTDPVELEEKHITDNTDNQLLENLNQGFFAATQARKKIKSSFTHPSTRLLLNKKARLLEDEISFYRNERDVEYNKKVFENYFEKIKFLAEKNIEYGAGNCGEFATVVYFELQQAGIKNSEIYRIENGDHDFVVVGRAPNSSISDFRTWGPNAIVIDGWSGKIYPASEIPLKLEAYVGRKKNESFTIPYDENIHKLELVSDGALTQDKPSNILTHIKRKYHLLRENIYKIDPNPFIPSRKKALENLKKQIEETNSVYIPGITTLLLALTTFNEIDEYVKKIKYFDFELQNIIDESYNTLKLPLFLAIEKNDFKSANYLLNMHADPNVMKNGNTPLCFAVDQRRLEITKILIEKDALIDQANDMEDTPLFIAVQNGNIDLAKLLLEKGANPNKTKKNGTSVLFEAVLNNDVPMVNLLLKSGAMPCQVRKDGITPLFLAARYNSHEIVELLLTHINQEKREHSNASHNFLNQPRILDNSTPLFMAAKKGHVKVVQSLLSKGANFEIPNTQKQVTPLEAAITHNHIEVVKLLWDQTNLKELDFDPVLLAIENGAYDIVKFILEKGWNLHKKNNIDASYFDIANYFGQVNIMQLLLNYKVYTNFISCLHIAAFYGDLSNTEIFLKEGANCNEVAGDEANTPLFIAAIKGHTEIVKKLLEHGANPNIPNSSETTPLHSAIIFGFTEIIKLLVSHGASAHANRSIDGLTPLDLAIIKGDVRIFELLYPHVERPTMAFTPQS